MSKSIVPRFKTLGANLLIASFCFIWPVFLAEAFVPFGVFLGVYLWPLGVFYLVRAARLEADPSFLPEPPPQVISVQIDEDPDVARANYAALLKWTETTSPGWPRSSQLRFAESLSRSFGSHRWSGSNADPRFSAGVDVYMKQREASPPTHIDLSEVWTRDQFAGRELKERFDVAPSVDPCTRYRATHRMDELGFVVTELPPSNHEEFVLYELFVPRSRRGQGWGSAILTSVEDLAWRSRREIVSLRARHLDPAGPSDERLAEWYMKRGYTRVDAAEGFQKRLR
jgi:GNAT superfamily N-acetyltransferase